MGKFRDMGLGFIIMMSLYTLVMILKRFYWAYLVFSQSSKNQAAQEQQHQ
jgi:hypothetical protein